MTINGVQLIAELSGCQSKLLSDVAALEELVTLGTRECGLHQVKLSSASFEPVGVTVIAIISESHVALHTYPEASHVSLDIFHCLDDITPIFELLQYFEKKLQASSVNYLKIRRGLQLDLQEGSRLV